MQFGQRKQTENIFWLMLPRAHLFLILVSLSALRFTVLCCFFLHPRFSLAENSPKSLPLPPGPFADGADDGVGA